MRKNFREMTWGMILGHLGFSLLGVFTLVVVAIFHEKGKPGEFIPVLALGVSYTLTPVISFFWCLLEKGDGQY
ncbi:MAG: hypothetical protein AAB352_02970 [Patescibacteria group bacterium]